MADEKRPVVDRTTGISIGLSVMLAALVVGWAAKDATFKESTSNGIVNMQEDINEIKYDLKESQKEISNLKVRVALVEEKQKEGR